MIVQTLHCIRVAECDRLPGTFPQEKRWPRDVVAPEAVAHIYGRLVPTMSSTDSMRAAEPTSTGERMAPSISPVISAGCAEVRQ